MKIGIISDTHDQVERIKKAIEILNKENIGLAYHLGDICSPFVLPLFKELKCNVKAVFGNNDADIFKLVNRAPENFSFHDRFFADEFNGKKICLFHGDPEEVAINLFESGKYDLLLRGHNHVAEIKRNEKTLMINPGNLIGKFNEYSKLWTEPSVAVYELDNDEAKIIKL